MNNVVTQWQEFRQAIYNNLYKAQDATFELMDALLLTRTAQSLADLSLSCVFRRQWPSVYEALQDTRARSTTINETFLFCLSLNSSYEGGGTRVLLFRLKLV